MGKGTSPSSGQSSKRPTPAFAFTIVQGTPKIEHLLTTTVVLELANEARFVIKFDVKVTPKYTISWHYIFYARHSM